MFVRLYAVDCVSLIACYRSDPAAAWPLTGCCQQHLPGWGLKRCAYALPLCKDCRRALWHESVATPSKLPT